MRTLKNIAEELLSCELIEITGGKSTALISTITSPNCGESCREGCRESCREGGK